MYLKEIKAHGFKSFADKINIELNQDITGIVGPNGSGKSNIVDAVRWVLGEQSVKSLRGTDSMQDVIFSGSKSRNSLNVASVTLVFDNSDNYLPVSFNEVSIKRRVYRDGTNEYYINGERCRLKDVTEILLDSGIAKESFNIISQGKIEDILSNKPADRRVVFEEAAGVLKYKRRKEDALRKLERTHSNMSRVDDIINELELQVNPLKEQKDKALEYLEVKEDLERVEVALIANDITEINDSYKEKKETITKLSNEVLNISTNSTGNEAKISELKLNIDKLNEDISAKQKELLDKTAKVEKINSRKAIILERQKYNVEDTKLHSNLINLKENSLKLQNDIDSTNGYIKNKKSELPLLFDKIKKQEELVINVRNKRNGYESNLSQLFRTQSILKNKIDNLRDDIDNNNILPGAVKSILDSPKLRGIHNVIGNLFEVNEQYALAISTSLGFASNNVVVDDEVCAKEAINYLKNNNLGRATFFPLSIIRAKTVDKDIIDSLSKLNGFIGIASDLLKFDSKYRDIILNQLGNVIVAKNIDSANAISKNVNYRYRVVTLDGELFHTGGSITGGNVAKGRNIVTLKYDLEKNLKEYDKVVSDIKRLEDDINICDNELKALEDKLYLINKDKMLLNDEIENRNKSLDELIIMLDDINLEIKSTDNMINKNLSKEEEDIINEYYSAVNERDKLSDDINHLVNKRDNFKESLEELEHSTRQENSLYYSKNKELNALEIEVNRMDVKLDNLLNSLNELYNITYEKAVSMYKLEMEVDSARTYVNKLKYKLKDIGIVNVGAIEEYARVSERYEFLINQKEDLYKAENTLLEIIEEMDNVMKKDFLKTFNVIKENFTKTFQDLFNGGYAELKLTDPSNILETGIEIIASPPGKKLSTISLLSGGEKTFTAISLLFAILKSRVVPFCILDEVEAALDEANVNSFGNYLKKLQEQTQFLVITHKKKTMEYMDVLYGITMQESGVSKLVSVKLEDVK